MFNGSGVLMMMGGALGVSITPTKKFLTEG